MVHILPHWNWQPGETLTIFAYTNCESVELFLNGESLGTQHVRPGRDLHLEWDVPFRPGTLRAEGRRSGLVAATAEVKTAGEPAAVKLTVDRGGICADGQDLAFVTTSIVDAAGVEVPMAKNLVEYELAGPAWLRAVDNGDPVSHESYQANSRRAYAGKSLAIVQAGRQAGETVITARSAELASDSLVIWCETAN
jgi:beta-galactosidase